MEAFGQSLTTPSPLPPGWRYKLYEYAPAEATLSATLDALSTLEETIVASGLQRTIGDCQHGLIAVSASNNMLEGGTGCHDWQAGFVLAEFILSNADLFKGKRAFYVYFCVCVCVFVWHLFISCHYCYYYYYYSVGRSCIELGCGLGVVGIALRRVGASSVLCTDGCQQTLANCERNLHMNGIRVGKHYEQEMQCHTDTNLSTNSLPSASGLGEVSLQLLRWEDGWNWKDPPAKDYETHIDIVLGADLLYDPGNIPLLIPLWKKLLVRGAATTQEPRNFVEKKQLVAYVVTKRRNEDTLKLFLETMALDNDLVMEDITAEANAHSAIGVRFCEMDDAREGILFHKIVHGG